MERDISHANLRTSEGAVNRAVSPWTPDAPRHLGAHGTFESVARSALLRSELAGAIFIIVETSSTSPWWSIRCALAIQNAFTIGATNFTGVTAAEHLHRSMPSYDSPRPIL